MKVRPKFKWGDAVMVLNMLVNGRRVDAQARYVCRVCRPGPKYNLHQVTVLAANSNEFFYVRGSALMALSDYFEARQRGTLPFSAVGTPDFLEGDYKGEFRSE